MEKLNKLLSELEENIINFDKTNLKISKSSVAWQLDHSLRVFNGIIMTLQKSDPSKFKSSFNFKKSLVFILNKIPRGRAKAPNTVRADKDEEITVEKLEKKIAQAKENIEILKDLDPNSNFKHPYFGHLNTKDGIKFIKIHTIHHLKIIRDILKE